ncbi:hypothetical protein ACVXHB_11630 [Escherichia coli]
MMIIMALVIAICAIVMGSAMRRLCHLPVLFQYRSRTTCTSGCNDYADVFATTLARAVFADYCGGGRYVRNCRRFAFSR